MATKHLKLGTVCLLKVVTHNILAYGTTTDSKCTVGKFKQCNTRISNIVHVCDNVRNFLTMLVLSTFQSYIFDGRYHLLSATAHSCVIAGGALLVYVTNTRNVRYLNGNALLSNCSALGIRVSQFGYSSLQPPASILHTITVCSKNGYFQSEKRYTSNL